MVDIIDRPANVINQIIFGKKSITPDTARALGAALGTSAQVWLNLESSYQLRKSQRLGRVDADAIAHRARIHEYAPVKAMIKRHWIEPSEDLELLESRICELYGVASLEESPHLKAVARKSTSYDSHTKEQIAWFCRARRLALTVQAAKFDHDRFVHEWTVLRDIACDVDKIPLIPKALSNWGIRLVIVEPIAKTRIDGATLWINESPVVVLSLRYDRIDAFWHTLIHELVHVVHKDSDAIDIDIIADATGKYDRDIPEPERRTNDEATDFLVPFPDLQSFMIRRKRRISGDSIVQFANTIPMHPGIIVGQLHHRGIPFKYHRKFLMQGQIRTLITSTAMTDGWGFSPGAV